MRGLAHVVLLAVVIQEADSSRGAVRHAVGKLAVHALEVALEFQRLLFALLLLFLQLPNLAVEVDLLPAHLLQLLGMLTAFFVKARISFELCDLLLALHLLLRRPFNFLLDLCALAPQLLPALFKRLLLAIERLVSLRLGAARNERESGLICCAPHGPKDQPDIPGIRSLRYGTTREGKTKEDTQTWLA